MQCSFVSSLEPSPSRRPCTHIPILLVDDEDGFRSGLADALRDDGHAVRAYESALQWSPAAPLGDLALLITDYALPGKDGLTFADEFHAAHRQVPIVLVTAFRTPTLLAEARLRRYLRLVEKPVDYDDLHALIHELVG